MRWLVISMFSVALSSVVLGQGNHLRPSFEVASIKPSDPNPANSTWVGMDANAGMVRYTHISLQDCIRAAYRVRDFQIHGPDWIRDSRYEITAKLGKGTKDQIPEMMQSLLEERFKLTLGRSTKEQSVYALVPGKGEISLKAADAKAAQNATTALGPDGTPRPAMVYQILPSGLELRARTAMGRSSSGSLDRLYSMRCSSMV